MRCGAGQMPSIRTVKVWRCRHTPLSWWHSFGGQAYGVFREIGDEVVEKNIQSCHRWKRGKSRTIVKFSNRKNSLEILRKKEQLCDIEPAILDLLQDTKIFINESSLPYYSGIWNKHKNLRDRHLIYQYYTISGTVCVKVKENIFRKYITHMVGLEWLFPEVDIESLWGIT